MRVAQKKKTFARTAHQSLNSNPKTLRQRKKTDNNRREPQRPCSIGSYARKLNCRLRGCRTICIFLFPNAGRVIQTRGSAQSYWLVERLFEIGFCELSVYFDHQRHAVCPALRYFHIPLQVHSLY